MLYDRVLEPKSYVLKRIVGEFRYFYPASKPSLPRIAFPVKDKMVSKDYVEQILKILEEDENREQRL